MQALYYALKKRPLVYITRDLDRALGLPLDTPGYYIISNATSVAKEVAQGRTNIVLIDEGGQLDTWEMLEHKKTRGFIDRSQVLVFKNSKKIEQICQQNGWPLLNPPTDLANKIEEKITQLWFLPELQDLFPTYKVQEIRDTRYEIRDVIQFNHSHTGAGTMLIESPEQLDALKQKFPRREVRVTRYIEGPIFTNNNIVHNHGVLIGNISYQITGLKPYTDNPFATVGNDWGIVGKLLTPTQIEEYKTIAKRVGMALKTRGWRGLFGIDVILEQATGRLYLLEINARQPQSTTFESQLQHKNIKTLKHENITTIFDAHLASLLDLDLSGYELIPIFDGMQIIDRRTNTWQRSEKSNLTCKTLSQECARIIADFLHLPLPTPVKCPYINNRRLGIRGGLRAQIGKGSPEEIVEEVKIQALKEKIDLAALNSEQLAKFLIDHNIGIDCSAFVFYVLDAELKARGKSGLKDHLKFPDTKTIWQKLRAKLRPIENLNVKTLVHDANSKVVELKDIQPGDIIIMLTSGERHDRDHVLLAHEVEHSGTGTQLTSIYYTHSFQWRTDGKYNHGVRQGVIEITDTSKPLTEQRWTEQGKAGKDNETWCHARDAMSLAIRRLKPLE